MMLSARCSSIRACSYGESYCVRRGIFHFHRQCQAAEIPHHISLPHNKDCVHTMPAHFENGQKFDG